MLAVDHLALFSEARGSVARCPQPRLMEPSGHVMCEEPLLLVSQARACRGKSGFAGIVQDLASDLYCAGVAIWWEAGGKRTGGSWKT